MNHPPAELMAQRVSHALRTVELHADAGDWEGVKSSLTAARQLFDQMMEAMR